jgi:hypothetical protein
MMIMEVKVVSVTLHRPSKYVYQLATMAVPSTPSTVTDITGALLDWTVGELNPVFKNAGCALKPIQ